MRSNVLNSPRLHELRKQRRRVFLNKFILILIACLVIFVGLGFISRLGRLNIASTAVSGNKVVDAEIIKEKVNKDLAGYYFWLFPKTNIFFYPKNKIKENLALDLKRLENISLEVGDDRVLQISVSEREALYMWCGEIILTETVPNEKEKCYFLDKNGFIFDEAPYFSGEVYFKFYGETRDSYFAKENFPQLVLFKETLGQMKLKPTVLYKMQNGDIKILLSSTNSSLANPEIILKSDSDLGIVAENLSAALDTEPLKTDFKKKYSSLIYIDLRFGNKVYYKFK